MSTAVQPMYEWNTIPWAKLERVVYKLQKRIYRASQHGDVKNFRDGDQWEIDHIVPRQQGGRDVLPNLQLLHQHCHDAKSARDRTRPM